MNAIYLRSTSYFNVLLFLLITADVTKDTPISIIFGVINLFDSLQPCPVHMR